MDYNTQRTKLVLPEYGRCIQDMVEYAMTIEDRNERQRCAFTIIDLMSNIQKFSGDENDFYQKLWNHLALISGYKLDIDYPVEIQRADEMQEKREMVPYPQKNIKRRHYGLIIERFTKRLADMDPGKDRDDLIEFVANQMKRSLASWNPNAMDDEKVMEDLADYTDKKVSVLPSEVNLISDRQALAEAQPVMANVNQGKRKKKK